MIENIVKIIKNIFKFLQGLFFPSICEGCGELGSYLCENCIKTKVVFVDEHHCHVCKKISLKHLVHPKCKRKSSLDGVFIVCEYSKFIENYIGDIKYEFYFAMIDDLVNLIIYGLQTNTKFKKIINKSIFTYVPLYKRRELWRGFNQSELLARKLSRYFNTDMLRLLKRVKNTKCQVGLARKERLTNVENAFKYVYQNDKIIKSVLIIDDVMTTGATFEECAKVLKENGIEKVYGLTVTRG